MLAKILTIEPSSVIRYFAIASCPLLAGECRGVLAWVLTCFWNTLVLFLPEPVVLGGDDSEDDNDYDITDSSYSVYHISISCTS